MKFLIIIPARGGSKGVLKKNIKLLHNKPLIQYTLDVASEFAVDENICISTDDSEIINTVEKLGYTIDFKRPDSLATDTATSQDVILHAVEHYEKKQRYFDAVILLQPTSPFKTITQLKEAISLYNNQLDMVVSVKETEANPYYNLFEENSQGYLSKTKQGQYTRRQDCPKVWEYNGAIYIINIKALKTQKINTFTKIKKYEMDAISSIDIDSPLDWEWCSFLLQKNIL